MTDTYEKLIALLDEFGATYQAIPVATDEVIEWICAALHLVRKWPEPDQLGRSVDVR